MDQHGADDSGGFHSSWEPPSEKRRKADKRSARIGKTTRLGRFREKLPGAGDVEKEHRWTVNKTQLESEEARPVVPGERTAKSGG